MAVNITDMVKSAVNIFQKLQAQAAEMVGLNTLWFRATPVADSADLILHEYGLMILGTECPRQIKVITSQGDYNPGNFQVDLFNLSYDVPFEINVPIQQWQDIFGKDTQPQKDDVVYFELYHKLYSVLTSQVMYTAISHPMYFKCSLTKYVPKINTMKTEEVSTSIDELTSSENSLFGKQISEEVADAVVYEETNYERTTKIDPRKSFDMGSIVSENLVATDGNIVSHAYYNLAIAEKPVVYSFDYPVVYSPELEKNHWIYTCWFRFADDPTAIVIEKPLRIFKLYQYDKQNYYFRISTQLKLEEGDMVTITRGKIISVKGTVVKMNCESGLFVKISTSEMNRINKQLTNWYESGTFKISKNTIVNIFKSNDDIVSVSVTESSNSFSVKFGKFNKEYKSKKHIDFSKWSYMCIDFSNNDCRFIMQQLDIDGMGKLFMNPLIDNTLKNIYPNHMFEISEFMIDSVGSRLNICNIRLYENEYPVGDSYKLDMMCKVTRNESKCIVVDAPNVQNDSMFYSPVR